MTDSEVLFGVMILFALAIFGGDLVVAYLDRRHLRRSDRDDG